MRQPLVSYQPSDQYGYRWLNGRRVMHHGKDYAARSGEPIYPIREGRVVRSGWHSTFGNIVVIQHDDGYESLYAHMHIPSHLKVNHLVNEETRLGGVGNTGYSFGNHLHLGVFKGTFNPNALGNAINPDDYFTRWSSVVIDEIPTIEMIENSMNLILILHMPTNRLLIADMFKREVVNLGNDPTSAIRAHYALQPYTEVYGPEWDKTFNSFTYAFDVEAIYG